MERAKKIIGFIPVLLMCAIIAWAHVAYFTSFIMHSSVLVAIILGIIINLLLAMVLVCYAKTVFTDPGDPQTLPDSTQTAEDIELQALQEDAVTVKWNGERRVCRKCSKQKPDRAHHCSICGRCVLKMDHHCPWVNNCVGFGNYKFFFLFLSYTMIYAFVIFGTVLPYTFAMFQDTKFDATGVQILVLTLAGGLFGISLLFFAGFHLGLILRNRTTIENIDRQNYKVGGQQTTTKHINLFDLGWRQNWREVMGTDPRHWFLPIKTSIGDGESFSISQSAYSRLIAA